ncbi:MAG TPA: arginine--tRNA ligase [Candidatus Saccharimonadales bacterium]|jgi:arginyl-tRNA synthetase|nr:arginine--tRNA ligase [Candidatus Saccharimonadales bacterium]
MSTADIQKIINEAAQKVFDLHIEAIVSRPDPAFGDFATNVAMQLATQLKQNPRAIAEQLQAELSQHPDLQDVTVAGPGFINLRVVDAALIAQLGQITVPHLEHYAGTSVVIEYSDPNPFKALHAGHLYTTIVGDAIARLLQAGGAEVHRLNYGGDVGLHVGKAMWGIIKFLGGEFPDKLADIPKDTRAEWLSARYVEGNTAYETDEAAKAEITTANKKVYQLHEQRDHESAFAQIYWIGREWSYEGFDQLYQQLQIVPYEAYVPESEVTPKGVAVVERGLSEGVFEKSDGAVVYKGESHGLHTRVFINAAGLPTYEAKDLGLAATKWERYHFDRNIIITANDIVEYMKVVLQALSHFYPEVAQRTTHLTHGVVKFPGGVKMSSRTGNTLGAQDILDAAREANMIATGKDDAEVVLAAVKYAFLKVRVGGDIIYDPAESVSIVGNSGPYLQYAHARARSILAKAEKPATSMTDLDENERLLAVKLSEYQDTVAVAISELMPHHICTYLYELAQVFNRFYENARIIGDAREGQRLSLATAYADTLRGGLELLGIPAPERL